MQDVERSSFLVFKIVTPHETYTLDCWSLTLVTQGHMYSFFQGHAKTVLLLSDAVINVYEEKERLSKTIQILVGVCILKDDVLTCLADNYTLTSSH